MALDKTGMDALMKPLRIQYLGQMRLWIAEMEEILKHIDKGQWSLKEQEMLKFRAHSLFGTGGAYGFKAVSDRAEALDTELQNAEHGEPGSIGALLGALLMVCKEAAGNTV